MSKWLDIKLGADVWKRLSNSIAEVFFENVCLKLPTSQRAKVSLRSDRMANHTILLHFLDVGPVLKYALNYCSSHVSLIWTLDFFNASVIQANCCSS